MNLVEISYCYCWAVDVCKRYPVVLGTLAFSLLASVPKALRKWQYFDLSKPEPSSILNK
jgi:hypothetical protein